MLFRGFSGGKSFVTNIAFLARKFHMLFTTFCRWEHLLAENTFQSSRYQDHPPPYQRGCTHFCLVLRELSTLVVVYSKPLPAWHCSRTCFVSSTRSNHSSPSSVWVVLLYEMRKMSYKPIYKKLDRPRTKIKKLRGLPFYKKVTRKPRFQYKFKKVSR